MFRRRSSIAFAVMLVSTALAADTTLTLACKGTTTDTAKEDSKPEPFSMGIIVNFTTRTVTGFTFPGATRNAQGCSTPAPIGYLP
jgi:hypothetical protein